MIFDDTISRINLSNPVVVKPGPQVAPEIHVDGARGLHIVVEWKNNPADMRSGRKKIISDDKMQKCLCRLHSVGFMQNRGFWGVI